jgi:glyoxylase-like metal-dependent hydrolase (beta-lactamase superfamily II)
VHTGDLFFNGRYPNIDLEAGGSVREWSATIDRILALDFEHVIPGHGPVTDADGLREFHRFMQQLGDIARDAERSGKSLAETQASAVLDADAGYDVMAIPFVMRLDRDFVVKRAWEEGTGSFQRVTPP